VYYGITRNATLLDRVPPGVVTVTVPVVAPVGTVVSISVFDITVKVAAMPLKLTAVVVFRFELKILM